MTTRTIFSRQLLVVGSMLLALFTTIPPRATYASDGASLQGTRPMSAPGPGTALLSSGLQASTPYTLTLSPSDKAGVAGVPITWTVSSGDPHPLAYQFSVAYAHFPSLILRDFSPKNTFLWTPTWEGPYTVTVAVKEVAPATLGYGQNPISRVSSTFWVTTPVTVTAMVSPTSNPLVTQYRAPSCTAGAYIVAQFRPLGTTPWTTTNVLPCQPPLTRSFYIAGMLPHTTYQMRHVILPGTASPILTFTTGGLPTSVTFPAVSVPQPPTALSDSSERIVDFQGTSSLGSANPVATNLAGQVVWYANQPDLAPVWSVRTTPGLQTLLGDDSQQPQTGGLNVLRQIDLANNVVRETNIGAINDQLAQLGDQPIYGFHHDALPLPNGDLAVLAYTTRTMTTTAILGDDLIVLDQNMQVTWVWDSFDHLDPTRGPTLGDVCGTAPAFLCPVPGGPSTIDWLHTNAIVWSPLDHNIVLSLRNQDWVIKINYDNGAGDGHVIWHLGPGGDFRLVPVVAGDPYPWFSHQHDPNFLDSAGATLAVFDNGNTRCNDVTAGTCHSRGQEYQIDEATRVVTQTLNVDLGAYSPALGTAQRLANGNFNFDVGDQGVPPSTPFGQAIEVRRNGTKVYVAQLVGLVYRAWRLQTMYSPTNPPCSTCSPGH